MLHDSGVSALSDRRLHRDDLALVWDVPLCHLQEDMVPEATTLQDTAKVSVAAMGKVTNLIYVHVEDLLEIIGNSKAIGKLQKHFKKMFAGVASVLIDDSGTIIYGLASRYDRIT